MRDASELPFTMSLAEALAGRSSVRNFKPDVLTRGQVRSLLLAAVQAPTAMHQEAWSFVVVQDKRLLDRISSRAKPMFLEAMKRLHVDRHGRGHAPHIFADPEFSIFYNARTLIVVCGPKEAPFLAADCWLAAGNIALAAHAAGLGSCVIGSALGALEMVDIRSELGIPDSHCAVAPIIVGVPAGGTEPSARKEPHILHWSHEGDPQPALKDSSGAGDQGAP